MTDLNLPEFTEEHQVEWPAMVAVSGGRDSWALLLRLLEFVPSDRQLVPVHYHHGMADHGTEAYENLTNWLETRNIDPVAARRIPNEISGNEEARARELRYQFFRSVGETLGVRDIFVAHHRMDQAETILMNVARGAGLEGISGMEPVTNFEGLRVLRPALELDPSVLHRPLTDEIPTVEDPDNQRLDRARTMIRHEILPRWEQVQPDPIAGITNTSDQARESRRYLDKKIDGTIPYWCWETEVQIDRESYCRADEVLRKRLLRRLIENLPAGVSGWTRDHFQLVDRHFLTARSGAGIDLPNGILGLCELERLVIAQPSESPDPTRLDPGEHHVWPEYGKLYRNRLESGNGGLGLKSFLHCNPEQLAVRFWEPGDQFPDQRGGVSLKTLFDRDSVPYRARRNWPVLEDEDGVVAIPGVKPSSDDPHESGEQLLWKPDHPSYHQYLERRFLP